MTYRTSVPAVPRTRRRTRPVWPHAVAAYLQVVLYVTAVGYHWAGAFLWSAPVVACAQLAIVWAVPEARVRTDEWLTPGNIAKVAWAIELVVVPGLVLGTGPRYDTLANPPSDAAVNTALLVTFVAYAVFIKAYVAGIKRRSAPLVQHRLPPNWLLIAYAALGVIGMALRFGSPGSALAYYTGKSVIQHTNSATLAGAASTFLRPFLGVAAIVWLSRRTITAGRLLVAYVVVIAAFSSYDYNRGAAVVASVAFLAVVSAHYRHLSSRLLAGAAVGLLVLAFAFGSYRTVYQGTRGGQISARQAALAGYHAHASDEAQLYAAAPQFTAVLVPSAGSALSPHGARPLIDTLLGPIPILGKPFRATSSLTIYNKLFYGRAGNVDKSPPLVGETLWALGLLGLLVFALLGALIASLERHCREAGGLVWTFAYVYLGCWLTLSIVTGAAVLAQILIYFAWPIYLLSVATRRMPGTPSRRAPAHAAARAS